MYGRLTMQNITKEQLTRLYLFVALFVGMMIRGYYEGEITSLVTVPEPKKLYQTIKEMFEENYNLWWLQVGSSEKIRQHNHN